MYVPLFAVYMTLLQATREGRGSGREGALYINAPFILDKRRGASFHTRITSGHAQLDFPALFTHAAPVLQSIWAITEAWRKKYYAAAWVLLVLL